MIESEKYAKNKLEIEGWKVIKGGAPDFLCVKYDKKNKTKIIDASFVEVKNSETNDYLKKKQRIYKNALEFLSCKYKLFNVEKCLSCGTFIERKSNSQKFCKKCAKKNTKDNKLIWDKKHRPFNSYIKSLHDNEFVTNNEALLHKHMVPKYLVDYDDVCSFCNKKVTNNSIELDFKHGDVIHRCGCIIGEITSQY